ncbi:hypothetical protein MPDQ_004497 [Monascus purpureus]|uniref:Uncharacterized protein n=1 Tax=Monascus purpureus TaxID=5098 RepID=A0A507QL14_MONPU|nr:hypothetical protein MPDQ_004497 [Monascus purpureus]
MKMSPNAEPLPEEGIVEDYAAPSTLKGFLQKLMRPESSCEGWNQSRRRPDAYQVLQHHDSVPGALFVYPAGSMHARFKNGQQKLIAFGNKQAQHIRHCHRDMYSISLFPPCRVSGTSAYCCSCWGFGVGIGDCLFGGAVSTTTGS